MSEPNEPPTPPAQGTAPSSGAIIKAVIVALIVAAAIFVTIVLPAEYGIDPLGTGAMTGVIGLSQTQAPPIVASTSGPIRTQSADFKTDTRQFDLLPYGGYVEYKYPLESGATILYKWTATGDVNFDFHTEPAGKPSSASESFERGTAREGQGSYIAPYTGIHGWFWENAGEVPVTITVTTVGFYVASKEFRDDGTTTDHAVEDFVPPDTTTDVP